MSVTSVTVTKKDYTDGCNLVAIHSPVAFEIEVAYPSTLPDSLTVQIYDDESTLLGTFIAIPYSDAAGVRTYVFLADDILRGYMPDVDDYFSNNRNLEYVPNVTKIFTIVFTCETESTSETFVAAHAVRQFGEYPYLQDIFDNEDTTYYAGCNMSVYVYFYNADTNNIISINEPVADNLLDYDNVALTDADGVYLISL